MTSTPADDELKKFPDDIEPRLLGLAHNGPDNTDTRDRVQEALTDEGGVRVELGLPPDHDPQALIDDLQAVGGSVDDVDATKRIVYLTIPLNALDSILTHDIVETAALSPGDWLYFPRYPTALTEQEVVECTTHTGDRSIGDFLYGFVYHLTQLSTDTVDRDQELQTADRYATYVADAFGVSEYASNPYFQTGLYGDRLWITVDIALTEDRYAIAIKPENTLTDTPTYRLTDSHNSTPETFADLREFVSDPPTPGHITFAFRSRGEDIIEFAFDYGDDPDEELLNTRTTLEELTDDIDAPIQ